MKNKRTTEIFVEMNRRFIIRQPASSERILCPECGETMLAAEHIADVFGITRRNVYRLIETGAAHFIETGGGAIYICPPSLEAFVRDAAKRTNGEEKYLREFEEK